MRKNSPLESPAPGPSWVLSTIGRAGLGPVPTTEMAYRFTFFMNSS